MGILTLVSITIIFLALGYLLYGSFLCRIFGLRRDAKTPAHEFMDNVDFVPAGKFYLLGQHFSAIAAAGPIVGPILAGMWFGWAPTILWIIFGGIFIGGVHDISALIASVRHQGKSIAEVIKDNMSPRAFILFLLFLWFSLIYIIITFTDITAGAFVDPANGASVASSSVMYLFLALIMGVVLRIFKPPLFIATLLFLPLVFVSIYLGPIYPLSLPNLFGMDNRATWDVVLLVYCFIAAIIPVWLLLQPRGYLGGFFLTFTAALSLAGIAVGTFTQHLIIQYPAFTKWVSPQGLPLLPLLFTTVACGACSGFHAIVASGTTAKQLSKETDAKIVGYGGMLLESLVAVIALGTLLLLTPAQTAKLQDPNQIYANGIAVFLSSIGINKEFALNFALLSFATFVYDTLDVATRLGRYIFEELTGWRNRLSPYIAALATLALPAVFVTKKLTDAGGKVIPAWKLFWPVFGASNQLLAAMTLFGISIWLFRKRNKFMITLLPSIFMIIVAVISLYFIIRPWMYNMFLKREITGGILGIISSILLLLALFLIIEGGRIFIRGRQK